MSQQAWSALQTELARTADAGGATRFWLRDDDAVAVSPALERLARLCETADMPILLAVIPCGATRGLADWLARHPTILPCQHGLSHTNHAAAGERACELGGARPDEAVLAELARGRTMLQSLVGTALSGILVPPWNRIRASLVPSLPDLGYTALSTFAHPAPDCPSALPELNCDLDIIDWRNGRRGRSEEDLCTRLSALAVAARATSAPIGLLTHHLAHDDACWRFLERFFERIGSAPSITFHAAEGFLR